MAFTFSDSIATPQNIEETSTVQHFRLGTRRVGNDPTRGAAEFIYLKGVASTAVGEVVVYDNTAATTTRALSGSRGPVAVAMSANVASQFGWYAVRGSVPVKSATVAANALVLATATAGTVDDAANATNKIDGAVFRTADGTPSAGFAIVELAFPALNGNG